MTTPDSAGSDRSREWAEDGLYRAAIEHAIECYSGPDDDTVPTLRAILSSVTHGITRDRRELMYLENFLAVNGTTETHRERQLRLYRYLCDTCEHEWRDVSGYGGSPTGTRQCSWCNVVLGPDEQLLPASTEPLPTDGPDYHAEHRAWQERFPDRITTVTSPGAPS